MTQAGSASSLAGEDEPPGDTAASRKIPWIVAAAFFMETLDGSVIATALPVMAKSFGTTAQGMSLGISGYLVAMAISIPAAGWTADRFGARKVFAGAIALFTLSSLLCALAPGYWAFIAARALQGCSAAFMSPVGRLVVLNETPRNRLIEALSTITWPGLIGPVVGPLVGGLIVTYASWHWIFLLNLPLGIAGIVLVLRYVPRRAAPARRRFDTTGFVLLALALAGIVEGLSRLGERQGSMAATLLAVAGGFACGAAAIRHMLRTPEPLIDLSVLRVKSFAFAAVTSGFASRVAINASPFLIPLMFQLGFGLSPLQSGFMVLVYMGGNLVMKSATTALLRRYGFRQVLGVNGILCCASLFACGMLAPGDAIAFTYPVLFIAGMTRSMNFTAITTLAYADVQPSQRSAASALAPMLQQLAATVGVAVAALGLSLSQQLRGASTLAPADFRAVWFFFAAVMAVVAFRAFALPRDAGATAAGR